MSGFSAAVRERIETALREAGREYFARYGLEKTTVAELADAAGIATGSFYTFFDSKERLYLSVLETAGEAVYGEALAALDAHDDPADAVEAFLRTLFAFAEDDPLVRQVLAGDVRADLVEATTRAERDAYRASKVSMLRPFMEAQQAAGTVRSGDPEVLALAVESVGLLLLHADEYGSEEQYVAVRDAAIRLVADGLTVTGGASRR